MQNNCKLIIAFIFLFSTVSAQENLPNYMTKKEVLQMPSYLQHFSNQLKNNQAAVPPSSPVRTMAEWEELQGILIGWTSYPSILREIVRAAKAECRVYIVTNNQQSVINYLNSGNVDTVNVSFVNTPFNSVWSRDYGPWSAYTNDVDTLVTIDWIYNRPRPDDDNVPVAIAGILNTPLYETTMPPYSLVHTGGNFMCDGFGTGFSSNLILNENPSLTESQIDTIMKQFMGISRYIKMPTLPYDGIHHIDMHMKLLNEETILMGQYPQGVADGPQIEANLLYVVNNFNSIFGTPYKVIRIPMPADNGAYPNTTGDYFTYTNSSFINNTIIVPTYNISQDSAALRIYKDALPGYNVIGINSVQSIGALGALHCITKDLGTNDPLLISHQQLANTCDTINPYSVVALIKHRSGIQSATLYYRTDTLQPYNSVSMTAIAGMNDYFETYIPAQSGGSRVYYYIEAYSSTGKHQIRPMPAPQGYFYFDVLQTTNIDAIDNPITISNIFPNPASAITCLPYSGRIGTILSIKICDVNGKLVYESQNTAKSNGQNFAFFDVSKFMPGIYFLKSETKNSINIQKILVK